MKKKHFYTAVILVAFLAIGIQPAHAVIQLTPTGWKDVNGNDPGVGTWDPGTLTGTLTQDVDEVIEITGNELTLDGGGHTLTELEGAQGTGVLINNFNGITVRNLKITGVPIGIWINNTNPGPENIVKNNVENNTISGCTEAGIRLSLANETSLTGNIIENNTNSSQNAWGIFIYNSGNTNNLHNGNTLIGNTIRNNNGGIQLNTTSSFNRLEENNVTGHTGPGIYLSVQSGNNALTNNTSSSNRDGIFLNDSGNDILTGNTLTGNTTSNNEYGIKLMNSSYNTLTGNTIDGNTNTGIWLDPSNDNTVTDNNISTNNRGIYILNSFDNDIYNNNFNNNEPTQAEVSGGDRNDFDGNYWSDWEGEIPYIFVGGQDKSPLPDTTPPEITCPGDTTVEAMGPDVVPVDDERIQTFLAAASATDNCDPPEDIIIINDAPAIFPPGDTLVTFTATDKSGNFSTCQSTVTVVEAAESSLRIIPRIINREGRLTKILAVIRFPAGTTAEDIDIGQSIILYPGDSPDSIAAINQRIVTWYRCGTLRVSVFAYFSKDEVTAGVPENGPAELMVIGRFESGQYFYGFDNVWICSWSW